MSDTPDTASGNSLSVPWIEMRRNPDPVSAPLCVALTQVVVEWSKFEYGLVRDLASLRAYPNVRALSPDEPRAFKKIIELWKNSIHTLFPTVDLYKILQAKFAQKEKRCPTTVIELFTVSGFDVRSRRNTSMRS